MATLPTDTRNVGQADPAADFDALVDVVSAITGVAPGGTVGTGQLISHFSVFGNGSDGAVTLDGSTTYAGFSSLAGSVYTLTRDVYATSFTINSGVTLKPVGYRIFVQGTLTNNGTIAANGNNGSAAGTAGGATGNGTLGGGRPAARGRRAMVRRAGMARPGLTLAALAALEARVRAARAVPRPALRLCSSRWWQRCWRVLSMFLATQMRLSAVLAVAAVAGTVPTPEAAAGQAAAPSRS